MTRYAGCAFALITVIATTGVAKQTSTPQRRPAIAVDADRLQFDSAFTLNQRGAFLRVFLPKGSSDRLNLHLPGQHLTGMVGYATIRRPMKASRDAQGRRFYDVKAAGTYSFTPSNRRFYVNPGKAVRRR